jgi:hypothetical protein
MITKMSIVLGLCLCLVFASHLIAEEGQKPAASPPTQPPGVRVLKANSSTYSPVKFDHQKHAAIAGNCAACHHHGSGDTASCKGCHRVSPSVFTSSVVQNFMPCSNCHAGNDRENPAMPGLKVAYHKKCFECHRGMGNIGLDPKGCTAICHTKRIQKASIKVRQ